MSALNVVTLVLSVVAIVASTLSFPPVFKRVVEPVLELIFLGRHQQPHLNRAAQEILDEEIAKSAEYMDGPGGPEYGNRPAWRNRHEALIGLKERFEGKWNA